MNDKPGKDDGEQMLYQRLDQTARFPYHFSEYTRKALWILVSNTIFRAMPGRVPGWRRFWLRLFGAQIHPSCNIRPGVRVVHPWLLKMKAYSCLADNVNVYNLGSITIGEHTVVSQYAHLCAGTHDYRETYLPLRRPPIIIGDGVWVCAEAFIGPGVTVGDNAIVGARAVVTGDVPAGKIVAGNPAVVLRDRPKPHFSDPLRRPPRKLVRVTQVTPRLSSRGGGVSAYVWGLSARLQNSGLETTLAGFSDELLPRELLGSDKRLGVITAPPTLLPTVRYSPKLNRRLEHQSAGTDILHVHGLRSALNLKVKQCAGLYGIPFVVSPHGQLYPEVLQTRPMRKKFIAEIFENQAFFDSVDCMHATSEVEAKHIREYGIERPIAIVPIGLEPGEFDIDSEEAHRALGELYPRLEGRKRVTFLSILHPKKGLRRLAHSWALLHKKYPDWSLVIAGPDAGYEAQARRMFKSMGVDNRNVEWIGGIYGHEKAVLLAGSDLMVLPSDWENFGIVVIEGLAARIPVIATHRAPWQELETRDCGWWVPVDAESICDAMEAGMGMSDNDRRGMGERGRQLVLEKYTWDRCASQMVEMYRAIAEQAALPDFVMVD